MNEMTITLDLGILGEKDFIIKYNYSPGRPGVHTLRNGDPGYPADPDEFETLSIFYGDLDVSALFTGNESVEDVCLDEARERYSERDCDPPDPDWR